MKRAFLLLPFAMLLLTARCGHDHESDGVIYLGAASDEAYLVLTDAEPRVMVDDAMAPVLSSPTEGQALPAATVPTFSWTAGFVAVDPRRLPARRPGHAPRLPAAPAPWGESAALAHLPPITGALFLLTFKAAEGNAAPIVVLTTESGFTPTAEVWTKLKALGGAITLEMTGAYLRSNVIEEGPFRASSPRHFTITTAQ
ncbi:MAG: hypothetical protein IT370_05300 [Deltaproteobacteria bacterium]|nr:hypothetical protein [Deltaproteobacteria bacterium]